MRYGIGWMIAPIFASLTAASPAYALDDETAAMRRCEDRFLGQQNFMAQAVKCLEQWHNLTSHDPERRDCAIRSGGEDGDPKDVDKCLAALPKQAIGPWTVHRGNEGEVLKASAPGSDGWFLSLECSRSQGLQAVLTNLDIDYPYRIVGARAKTDDHEESVDLAADQSMAVRGLIHLKGVDAIEDGMLRNERIIIRLTRLGSDDLTTEFKFSGMNQTGARVRATCPKF